MNKSTVVVVDHKRATRHRLSYFGLSWHDFTKIGIPEGQVDATLECFPHPPKEYEAAGSECYGRDRGIG